jgi:superfamily I DNA/RNA helicase
MAKDNELLSAFGVQKIYGTRLSWLKTQAKINFKSKEKPDVYLATGHTSKGLEWGSVELAPDFPDIQRLLKDAKIKSRNELMKLLKEGDATAASIVQEINLRYVAITRAKHTVNVTI